MIAQLITWAYNLTPDQLPKEPWKLSQGVKVVGNEKFLSSIKRDIEEGPLAPRARTGALIDDIKNMWNKCNASENNK